MKKRYVVTFFIIVFGCIFWILLRDAAAPTVQTAPVENALAPEAAPAQKDDVIVVESPRPQAVVSSPLVVKGKARGNWYFEGSFPMTITDWDGVIIGEGYATAQGEWMTTEYVPFTATLTYLLPENTAYRRGFLILKKDNPSGEPQFDNSLEIPVTF